MVKLTAVCLLLFAPLLARADDDDNWPEPCTFKAHTNVGTLSGTCSTLQLNLPGFHFRWTLTLEFDAASAKLATKLRPDQFVDMVRTQSMEDGTDVIVLPMWGDLEVLPTDPEYLQMLQAVSPIYETTPDRITITEPSNVPFTIVLLFEEPDSYLNLTTRMPSPEWWEEYLKCYYRLGTNRPDGFSSVDGPGSPGVRQRWSTPPKKQTPEK